MFDDTMISFFSLLYRYQYDDLDNSREESLHDVSEEIHDVPSINLEEN